LTSTAVNEIITVRAPILRIIHSDYAPENSRS